MRMCVVSEKKRKSRRSFTPEYRKEAAHLVIDTGRTIAAVASEIGVGSALLGRWVAAERAGGSALESGRELGEDEWAELVRLRKEVVELRLDNEFLGKVAAFFASKQQNRTSSR